MSPPSHAPSDREVDLAVTHASNPTADAADGPAVAKQIWELVRPAFADREDRRPQLDVVDIGANPIDGDPPYRLLLDAGLCRVTGFEPQPEALAELRERASRNERYLPYAVGDGDQHTFYHCATSGFASLLEPDERQLKVLTDFPELARVTGSQHVETMKLDDISEIAAVDFLKIDIQGGELAVLRAGRGKLARAVAVQTEVGFHRLYREQPTFADVDLELRSQGFTPHQFVATRTWPMAPIVWADPLQRAGRQLVEADLLYVRDPARLNELDVAQLARLVLVADIVYGSYGLALRCLLELIARGVLDDSVASEYRFLASARVAPQSTTG